jgi:N-acetylmuramoyl-L-alanine amidase
MTRRTLLCIAALAALQAPALALSFTTVVIDAGHGGEDPGAVWSGIYEKRLCLDVAQRVESALRARGMNVAMTRRGDSTVSLESRAAIANRFQRAVFVSIHFNANRNRSISGIETHYRSDQGRVLASAIQAALARQVRGTNRGVDWEDFKVLRETKMPAVLIECGFLSNRAEAARCATVAHRQKIADAITAGILAARR